MENIIDFELFSGLYSDWQNHLDLWNSTSTVFNFNTNISETSKRRKRTGIEALCGAGLLAKSKLCYEILLLLFEKKSFYIDMAKIAVLNVVFWFSPYHENSKRHR